jgi:hypothetical protein
MYFMPRWNKRQERILSALTPSTAHPQKTNEEQTSILHKTEQASYGGSIPSSVQQQPEDPPAAIVTDSRARYAQVSNIVDLLNFGASTSSDATDDRQDDHQDDLAFLFKYTHVVGGL